MARLLPSLALPLLLLAAGCSPPDAPGGPPAPAIDSAPDSATPAPTPSPGARMSDPTAPARDDRPLGLTDRNIGEPTRINKVIARCAKQSEGIYESGTTWFTDGTSGWTTYCADRYRDGPPPTPAPEWTPEPTDDGTAPEWDGPAPSHGDGRLPGDAGDG